MKLVFYERTRTTDHNGKLGQMNTKITVNDYEAIKSIVDKIAYNYSPDIKEDLKKRFFELFRILNFEQRNLMKLLSINFKDISAGTYINILYDILKQKLDSNFLDKYTTIYAIPVAADKVDKTKTKSGNLVAYLIPTVLNMVFNYDERNVYVLSNASYLSEHSISNNSLIFLCDNFIGTGNQVKKCIETYKDFMNITDNIIIITIAILECGFKLLENKYPVIYGIKYKRAISDDQTLLNLQAKRIMEEIESIIKVPKKYKFGYNNSEALLSFDLKAPNNTFPIYWYKGNSRRTPIFPG